VSAKLELGVGKNNPVGFGDCGSGREDLQRAVTQRRGEIGADKLHRALERDVLVVLTHRRFPRGRVDRFGQAVAVNETRRKGNTTHALTLLVLKPAAARQVTAHDTLDRIHRQRQSDHSTPCDLCGNRLIDNVIGNRRQLRKPPQAQTCEQFTLRRDARLQHVIESTHPITGHHEHSPRVRLGGVQIADLAAIEVIPAGDINHWASLITGLPVLAVLPLLTGQPARQYRCGSGCPQG
jgi:hypothetical protein